jgi:hypothetical protein
MTYSPLAIKRNYILGDIYQHCDRIESIPVYLNNVSGELLGYVDEELGPYIDAFLFHLPEDICKKLSSGHYQYGFDYDVLSGQNDKNRRVKLNCIVLLNQRKV